MSHIRIEKEALKNTLNAIKQYSDLTPVLIYNNGLDNRGGLHAGHWLAGGGGRGAGWRGCVASFSFFFFFSVVRFIELFILLFMIPSRDHSGGLELHSSA